MQHVALLGLGIMGMGMARNLTKAGVPLTVYNRSTDKAQALAAEGAQVALTPREAAAQAFLALVQQRAVGVFPGWLDEAT